jgi:hypothetical protein
LPDAAANQPPRHYAVFSLKKDSEINRRAIQSLKKHPLEPFASHFSYAPPKKSLFASHLAMLGEFDRELPILPVSKYLDGKKSLADKLIDGTLRDYEFRD